MALPATMAVYQQIKLCHRGDHGGCVRHAGEGGVYLEEAVKNAQEEDNAVTSAAIDVGEMDSDDEVFVATAVTEDSSNICDLC
jgi:hypothetical protein